MPGWLNRLAGTYQNRGKPFNLPRWFAVVGLLSITAISVAAGALLSRYVSNALIEQDAVLSMEFVQSVLLAEGSETLFEPPYAVHRAELESMFNHVANMPHVLRANIYAADRGILWSSDPSLIGRRFDRNPDLDRALNGEVVAESGVAHLEDNVKPERATMQHGTTYFVESYLPVRNSMTGAIVGVVEIYKTPQRLFETIGDMQRWIWLGSMAAGLFLYAALFSMVRRADNVIRQQQEQLVQSETLAAMGEMGTAVAHGIRNPLASMRSSAELALDSDPATAREAAEDIIAEADRLELWVSSLLNYARPADGSIRETDLYALVDSCAHGFIRECERRNIVLRHTQGQTPASISADPQLMAQVINSLISNALEATPPPLHIDLDVVESPRAVSLTVRDDGPGMDDRQISRAFRPFFTTKPKGLGIGLPLAKRIVERFGGRITIDSRTGAGTAVCIAFPRQE